MDSATADRANNSSRPVLTFTLYLVALILFVYPLSVGPVDKFYGNGRPPRAVLAFYAPVGVLYDNIPAVRGFYDWYFGLWGIK